MKDVSIVYVNYKTKDITLNSIRSVIEHTEDVDYEIILVDNNSKDGIVEEVKRLFPEVIVVESDKNLGFAGGCNLGLKYASGKYVLFLNTDTVLNDNVIKKMYVFMENNTNFGVVGVLLTDEEGCVIQSWGDFLPFKAGIREFLLKPFLPRSIKNRINFKGKKLNEFEKDFFRNSEFVEVDYIIGADMFVRRKVFDEVGGFDDTFFMYFEEADLQIRVKRSGYKIGIIKGANIVHLESKSFKVSNSKRTMKMVSFLRYLKKNFLGYYLIFKPLSIVYGLIKVVIDFFIREYAFVENWIFVKSILLETYEYVKVN